MAAMPPTIAPIPSRSEPYPLTVELISRPPPPEFSLLIALLQLLTALWKLAFAAVKLPIWYALNPRAACCVACAQDVKPWAVLKPLHTLVVPEEVKRKASCWDRLIASAWSEQESAI